MGIVSNNPFHPVGDVTDVIAILRNQPVGDSHVRKLQQSVLQLLDTQKDTQKD